MVKELIVGKRYCGPSTSGQGGYVCGLIGSLLEGPAEVILRVPPPLDRTLTVHLEAGDLCRMTDGDTLVAEGRRVAVEVDAPPPPSYAEAQDASKNYFGFTSHPFPECFVCGPARALGDGMRIFPGPVSGTRMVAAPWTPDASLCSGNGVVRPEFIWAALDCPGAFGAMGDMPRIIVLGKLAVSILKDVRSGERYIVTGWMIEQNGRKNHVGTAIFSESGGLCAKAKATWIELK